MPSFPCTAQSRGARVCSQAGQNNLKIGLHVSVPYHDSAARVSPPFFLIKTKFN